MLSLYFLKDHSWSLPWQLQSISERGGICKTTKIVETSHLWILFVPSWNRARPPIVSSVTTRRWVNTKKTSGGETSLYRTFATLGWTLDLGGGERSNRGYKIKSMHLLATRKYFYANNRTSCLEKQRLLHCLLNSTKLSVSILGRRVFWLGHGCPLFTLVRQFGHFGPFGVVRLS